MSGEAGFGEFVIDSLIGEGGMGKVFRARQVALDRWVALKVLPRADENPTFIERFFREARSAAKLVHPNIIQIHTVGDFQGVPFFAMEYVEGEDLENICRSMPELFSNDELIEIMRCVAKALALAMEHNIVHRDIKPANIMITRSGLVKVMDFGLAKGMDQGLTQAGLIVGTPSYISPEQGSSKPVDSRSDIYSLGCVLYRCCCGHPPFAADNIPSLLYKHMYEAPEPLNKLCGGLDERLEQIIFKMLAKAPEERYQNPQELLAALAGIPSNSSAAELALGQRASSALEVRKTAKPHGPGTVITPEGFMGIADSPRPAEAPENAAPAAFVIPQRAPEVKLPAAEEPPRMEANATPRPSPPLSRSMNAPPPPAPRSKPSRPKSKVFESEAPPVRMRVNEAFLKLPDGRWSYRLELGKCPFAEGIATQLPTPGECEGLGDCLLCCNWNKRLGCALAYNQELEAKSHYTGLKLLVEQVIAWMGAGRFDRAIEMLDRYIANNPVDAAAHLELARIYERPDYIGRDKRRAIVLYKRFADLARERGGFPNVEIVRAEERAALLLAAPPPTKISSITAAIGIAFQCFYRGGITCFSYGVLSSGQLVVARAGEVDPESGIVSADMGGVMGKATTFFRRLKSEQARKKEQAKVKQELTRLSGVPFENLQSDPARILFLPCEMLLSADMDVDSALGIRCITIKASSPTGGAQTHQLLFTEAAAFKAEQCFELLRRRTRAGV